MVNIFPHHSNKCFPTLYLVCDINKINTKVYTERQKETNMTMARGGATKKKT
jgi:hypothetical protein